MPRSPVNLPPPPPSDLPPALAHSLALSRAAYKNIVRADDAFAVTAAVVIRSASIMEQSENVRAQSAALLAGQTET